MQIVSITNIWIAAVVISVFIGDWQLTATISICGIIYGFGMLLRNEVVFRIRRQRIAYLHREAMRSIKEEKWSRPVMDLDPPTYEQMMDDWSRWSYRAFYKEGP